MVISLAIFNIIIKSIFCGGKYRHNSIKNDYCGGKPGFVVSRLGQLGQ